MNTSCELSRNTLRYLECFEGILREMILKMTEAEPSCSISDTFIRQMIPHHQAAIEMSKSLLKYTTDLALQEIADNIIREQTRSIENMQRIQESCLRMRDTECEVRDYQNRFRRIAERMFCGMENAGADNCIDRNFLHEMIPHHEGAVEMSQNVLRFQLCSGLYPILDAIITSQCEGIRRMKELERCI